MAGDYYKTCSISLAIGEMQIKTILRSHITPVRVALINKFDNKCWRQYGEQVAIVRHWWGCRLTQPLWTLVWGFLQSLKAELPWTHPPSDLLGPYSQISVLCHRDVCVLMVMAASLAVAKDWNQPSLLSDEQVVKIWCQYRLEFYQL